MDELTYQKIQQYQQALKALQRSVERSLQEGTHEGTGKMGVKSYQGIQRKIAELLPDDFYVTDTLVLESNSEDKERHMLSQVQLAASQMIIYLEGVLREQRIATGRVGSDPSDWKTIGRELQEQILNMTRATIKRAVENVDIDVQGPDNLRDANMEGAHLEGANFSGRNLKNANLKGADLRNADFSGANMANANLEGANADGANFSGANLKDASLKGANLKGTNLTGANLKNADVEGANLLGAKIAGANFKDASLKGATMPQGQEFKNDSDLYEYGASGRGGSSGRASVRIVIGDDDEEEEKEKRKNDEEKPKNDEDDKLV